MLLKNIFWVVSILYEYSWKININSYNKNNPQGKFLCNGSVNGGVSLRANEVSEAISTEIAQPVPSEAKESICEGCWFASASPCNRLRLLAMTYRYCPPLTDRLHFFTDFSCMRPRNLLLSLLCVN